ncbi:phiSA1p31-related protein [Streptomyces sp. NPDC102264]|uniref:phiSA1p31-related protein n=1 Tax=Streptomyces sp. NPDC102264 TaxID=3366149 RepID=UPI0037FC6607
MTEQTFKVGDKVRVLSGGDGKVTYGPVNSTFDTYKMYVVKQDGDEERAFKAVDLAPLPAFTVGDKAKMVGESDPVEIIGGPFKNRYHTWFAVKSETGEHYTASEDNLTALPAPDPIKVGDRVRVTEDDPYTRTGEFVGKLGTVCKLNSTSSLPYNVEFDSDQGAPYSRWAVASVEKIKDAPALVSIGTRVRVDRAKWAEESHGMTGVVTSNTQTFRSHVGDTHVYDVELDDGPTIHVAELTLLDEPADTVVHRGITYDLSATYRDRDGDAWRFARVDGVVRGACRPASSRTEFHITGYSGTLREVVDAYGPLSKI